MKLVGSCEGRAVERHVVNAWVSRMVWLLDVSMLAYIIVYFGCGDDEDTAAIGTSVQPFREEGVAYLLEQRLLEKKEGLRWKLKSRHK